MYRRDFIKTAGGAIVSYVALSNSSLSAFADSADDRMGYWIGASMDSAKQIGGGKYKAEHNLFSIYDMDRKIHTEMEIPIGLSHDTVPHPTDPSRVLVVENQGPYACEVDIVSRKVIRRLNASPGHFFIGHAMYSQNGEKIYLGQYPIGRMDVGTMLVLDAKTGKEIGKLDSGGVLPVEFAWLPDKRTVAIGHYGVPGHYYSANLHSNLTIYDTVDDKVLDVIEPPSPNLYMCHVKAGSDGRLFVITHNMISLEGKKFDEIRKLKENYKRFIHERPPFFDFKQEPSPVLALEKGSNGKYKIKFQETQDAFRWGLSVVINEKHNVVGGTHGLGPAVSFQDYRTGEVVAVHKFENDWPRSMTVTLNQRYFVVTTTSGQLHYFDAISKKLAFSENPKPGRYSVVIHSRCLNIRA